MSTNERLREHNQAAHDRVAASYDRKHTEIYNPVEQERLDRTVSELLALVDRPGPRVLDVGAGTGNLTLKFLAAGCSVCAADVSRDSLEVLMRKAGRDARIDTRLLTGERLPFEDASFDAVATYSVLHHVPDYLLTVREMARVLRPGGFLYIDHEASPAAWQPGPALQEYRRATRLPKLRHILQLVRTGEMFTPAFAKTAFMKAFVNPRYEREGDLHVWVDDHIEWDRIEQALAQCAVDIVRVHDYLLYQPRGGEALHSRYRDRCEDTRLLFGRKA